MGGDSRRTDLQYETCQQAGAASSSTHHECIPEGSEEHESVCYMRFTLSSELIGLAPEY